MSNQSQKASVFSKVKRSINLNEFLKIATFKKTSGRLGSDSLRRSLQLVKNTSSKSNL